MFHRAQKNAHITWTPLPEKLIPKRIFRKKRKSGIWSLLTIFLSLIIVILIAIIYFSTVHVGSAKGDTVSAQKLKQNLTTSDLVAAKKSNRVVVEENCYGLTAPFGFRKIARIDVCSVFISLESPHGSLVIDYRDNGGARESSDILMRRANADTYQESPMKGRDGYEYITFKNIRSQNYERTAFLPLDGITIGITLKTDSPSDYDTEFQRTLSSFYCIDGCKSAKLD